MINRLVCPSCRIGQDKPNIIVRSNPMRNKKVPINPEMSVLFRDFARYFDLSLALNEEQRAGVHRVRYRVYCEEFGYEPAEVFSDRQEIDDFDQHSLHCLITHRETGMPAGCVRVVNVDHNSKMPMEVHCGDHLDPAFMEKFADRRETVCEISRLAVDGAFRRRRGESETRFGDTSTLHFSLREKRTFSLLAVVLFLSAAAVAELQKRNNCFAIMEPFLPAILKRSGIFVTKVGDEFNYRGRRAPYYKDIYQVVERMPDELRLCYQVVRDQYASMLDFQRENLSVLQAENQQKSTVAHRAYLAGGSSKDWQKSRVSTAFEATLAAVLSPKTNPA